jgi:hypothetical protein
MSDLLLELVEIDNRRFEDVLHALRVTDACSACDHFNPTIRDPMKGYRCRVAGSCIAATLHPEVQSYMWLKLGWIDEAEHRKNLRLA